MGALSLGMSPSLRREEMEIEAPPLARLGVQPVALRLDPCRGTEALGGGEELVSPLQLLLESSFDGSRLGLLDRHRVRGAQSERCGPSDASVVGGASNVVTATPGR